MPLVDYYPPLPDLTIQQWLMGAMDMMMTRQHIISYQNVESWKRFHFFRVGFIVAQLNIYVAHRMLANVIQLLCILLIVITRQTRNWKLNEIESKRSTFDGNIEHWFIYPGNCKLMNQSTKPTSQNNIQFNSVQLYRCFKTAPIVCYSGSEITF